MFSYVKQTFSHSQPLCAKTSSTMVGWILSVFQKRTQNKINGKYPNQCPSTKSNFDLLSVNFRISIGSSPRFSNETPSVSGWKAILLRCERLFIRDEKVVFWCTFMLRFISFSCTSGNVPKNYFKVPSGMLY